MFHEVSFVKINSLILPILSLQDFPKSIYKVPGKKYAEAYSEYTQTSKTKPFAEIVNDF